MYERSNNWLVLKLSEPQGVIKMNQKWFVSYNKELRPIKDVRMFKAKRCFDKIYKKWLKVEKKRIQVSFFILTSRVKKSVEKNFVVIDGSVDLANHIRKYNRSFELCCKHELCVKYLSNHQHLGTFPQSQGESFWLSNSFSASVYILSKI